MQKEWSSFRITLLLYLVVFILPFSFYYVYTSFQTMQQDTKIVRQSTWSSRSHGHITNKNDQKTKKILIIHFKVFLYGLQKTMIQSFI